MTVAVGSTTAIVTITPPTEGCVPVSYRIAHAPSFATGSPSLTTVAASQDAEVTVRLGNLGPIET